jgi:hypothetical protein
MLTTEELSIVDVYYKQLKDKEGERKHIKEAISTLKIREVDLPDNSC